VFLAVRVAAFFAAAEREADLRAVFAAGDVLAGDLRAPDWRAPGVLAADFLAETFFAVDFFAVDFFAAGFSEEGPFAPPSCLFTVAHARFAATFFETPFSS
jgi:hypothetical protein